MSSYLQVVSANERDHAHALAWMMEASKEERYRVWMRIQEPCADVTAEIISRFAQLAFAEITVEAERLKNGKRN